MSGRRRVGFLRFHPLDFWTKAGPAWHKPKKARWFRLQGIEGIDDDDDGGGAGGGFGGGGLVPAGADGTPGFLFVELKFGRHADAFAAYSVLDMGE